MFEPINSPKYNLIIPFPTVPAPPPTPAGHQKAHVVGFCSGWFHHCPSAWYPFPKGEKGWGGRDPPFSAKVDGKVAFERWGKDRRIISIVPVEAEA